MMRKNPDAIKNSLEDIKKIVNKEIAVGFPAGKALAYSNTGESVASVAAQHVFGIEVPKRDFMTASTPAIYEKTKFIMKRLASIIKNGKDPKGVGALMEAAGQVAADCIKKEIVNGDWVPNSEAPMSARLRQRVEHSWGILIPQGISYAEAKRTLRGSNKPLIDTGHMVNSVTYAVRDKKA